ncbi:MAG: hypothetical protein K2X77_07130 [Candidatus Obscuribacterales bacterium]|nr:hypothetical protein [Candidatus Obscuribacterales bacterium]
MQGPARSLRAKDTTIAEIFGSVKNCSKRLGETASFFNVKAFNGSVDRVIESVSKGREIVVNAHVFVESCKAKIAPTSSSAWRSEQIPHLEESGQS